MKKRLAIALALTILMTGVVACDKNSDDERSSRRRDEDTETVDDDRSSKSDEDEVEVTVEETTVETTVETTAETTVEETTIETTVEETEVVEEYTIDDFLSWGLTEGDYYIYNAMTYGEQVSDISQLEGSWRVDFVYGEINDPLGGEGDVMTIVIDADGNPRITYSYATNDYPCGLTPTNDFTYFNSGDVHPVRTAYIYGDYVALDNVILLVRQ